MRTADSRKESRPVLSIECNAVPIMFCVNTDPAGFVESAKGDKVDHVSLIIHGIVTERR